MEATAITAALIGSGFVQKRLLAFVPNNLIPFINAVIGVLVFFFYGDTAGQPGPSIAAGVAAAAAATGAHQAGKIVGRTIQERRNLKEN